MTRLSSQSSTLLSIAEATDPQGDSVRTELVEKRREKNKVRQVLAAIIAFLLARLK
jgi:hypothetical protein